uniref:Uncharacterized protein n=1 Tax=Oncorhynchus tshawytscha TaxID=74940 RepID=A0A8C8FB60_ONCTS
CWKRCSLTELKRAARLLVWRLACSPSRLWTGLPCWIWVWVWVGKPEPFLLLAPGAAAGFPVGLMKPVHLLICFCRYLRWLTFLLDLTGLSKASLMLLEAESMKLSRFLVVSLYSPLSSLSSSGLPSSMSSSNQIFDFRLSQETSPRVASQCAKNG